MRMSYNKKKVVISGGCGFIGHHTIEHLIRKTDWDIVVLDKLTYASFGLERLRDINAYPSPRVKVFPVDITQPRQYIYPHGGRISCRQQYF